MTRIWNKHKQFHPVRDSKHSNGAGTPLKRKVLVAMSGGVDSSVAAALLKKEGYDVMGGFMKNFSSESWQGVIDDDCPWEADFEDVRKVCEVLKIPYRSFNFEKEYKERVIEYFFKEYEAGRTPNPDIMCNKEIKFKIFLEKAKELGFDYIATGHYARIQKNKKILRRGSGQAKKQENKSFELLKGVDSKKDQSYFLYTLNQEQISRTLFPIGKYKKSEVRALARKFKLPNAEKKDSQGICFVGHIDLREFLKQRIPEKSGVVADTSGKKIGVHSGAWYYTVGQRKGIGIGGTGPWYVVKKNTRKNTLTVAHGNSDEHLYSDTIYVKNFHWISEKPKLPIFCKAKIRHQQKDQKCRVKKAGNAYKIHFEKPQFAPALGQSVVCYRGVHVLGGGVIERIEEM